MAEYLLPDGSKENSRTRTCSGMLRIRAALLTVCLSQKEPKSLCFTPVIFEQTFTMLFRLFLSRIVR